MAQRFVIVVALLSGCATPGTEYLHVASKHWDGESYNEWNPGIGYQVDVTPRFALEPGMYWNSHQRPSTYGMASYRFAEYAKWRFRAAVGFADRYDGHKLEDGRAIPIAGIIVQYGPGRAINIPGVTGFGLEVPPWN